MKWYLKINEGREEGREGEKKEGKLKRDWVRTTQRNAVSEKKVEAGDAC